MQLDYLAHLASDSQRFAEVLRPLNGTEQVPTCPDWHADDLLFHLSEVQSFWARIVSQRITEQERAVAHQWPRPADRTGLLAAFDRASADLGEALAAAPPETMVWTWADEQTAGFVRRRQAHEALIHRVDAEQTAGTRTAIDADLAADGVDEVLTVMYGDPPSWGEFSSEEGHLVRFTATDTARHWDIAVGRLTGEEPVSGKPSDFWCLAAATPGTAPTLEVAGHAADLDCWLWRRPTPRPVHINGEAATRARLESVLAEGIS
jgi:uncharacterized protein (TIGR03083 family)